jgi:hypothetical protein
MTTWTFLLCQHWRIVRKSWLKLVTAVSSLHYGYVITHFQRNNECTRCYRSFKILTFLKNFDVFFTQTYTGRKEHMRNWIINVMYSLHTKNGNQYHGCSQLTQVEAWTSFQRFLRPTLQYTDRITLHVSLQLHNVDHHSASSIGDPRCPITKHLLTSVIFHIPLLKT